MKKITAYEALDGSLHKTSASASVVNQSIRFDTWYEDNYLLGDYAGSRVELNEMKNWLFENKAIVLSLLEGKD